jgi:alpha-tubulin suppressor-like RCC1 family protein
MNGTLVRVRVSNAGGSATSNAVLLTVTAAIPPSALVAASVIAGQMRSFAVTQAGEVWGWGSGVDSTTGHYTLDSSRDALHPVRIQGLSDVRSLAL